MHLAVLLVAGLTLPLSLAAGSPPTSAEPFLWVPWLLLISVGPLFFAISAQAPLLQRWLAGRAPQDAATVPPADRLHA